MTRRVGLAVFALTAIACGGGGGGHAEKIVPNPVAPGEIITVSLCGSTNQPMGPCGNSLDNTIQIRIGNNSLPAPCPCFTFTFLNQTLSDLGPATTTTYEFTGFRPGTYQVSGQLMTGGIDFGFVHNPSTSTIGVVPASIQSLTGPAKSANLSCSVGYSVPNACNQGVCSPDASKLPASLSFQFTVAAGTAGGTC